MRRIANAIKERELLPLEENERGAIARNLKWCIETAGATPQEMDAAVHDMLLEREYDDLDLIMPSQALESLRELMARRDTHADDEPEEDPSRDEYLEYLDDLMDHTCTRTGAAMKGYFEGHCDARRVVAEATEELGESFRQHLPSLESDVRRHLDELGDYGDTPPDDQDGFDFEEHVKELEDLLDDLHGYDEDE